MKKTLALLGATLLTIQSASAVIYEDIQIGLPIATLNASSDSTYSGTWDLLADGYNPATEQIYYALATFVFADKLLHGGSEEYRITLGTDVFDTGGNVDLIKIIAGEITGNAFATLNSSGKLDFEVTALSGKFYLKEAGVIVKAKDRRYSTVPDGGATVVLLGLGLLALIAIQKRTSAA